MATAQTAVAHRELFDVILVDIWISKLHNCITLALAKAGKAPTSRKHIPRLHVAWFPPCGLFACLRACPASLAMRHVVEVLVPGNAVLVLCTRSAVARTCKKTYLEEVF